MMRKLWRLSACLLLYCFFLSIIAKSQVQKIYLNPGKTNGIAKQSDYIDSIHFIPLESTGEGASNTASGSNLEVTARYFLLTFFGDRKLIVYTREGKYLRTISFKNLKGNFVPTYVEATDEIVFFGYNSDYTLTRKDRIKIELGWNLPKNRKYFRKYVIRLGEDNPVLQKATPTQYDVIKAKPLYGDYYASGQINTSELYKDSIEYELRLFRDNGMVKGYFPYNRVNEPRFLYDEPVLSIISTDTPSLKYVTRPYNDTVYKLIDTTLFPVYKVVLPAENSLPASFFTVPFSGKIERENFVRNNGWLLSRIFNWYETPKYILLNISYLTNSGSYIVNKQTGATVALKNIKPDKSQYDLHLLNGYGISRKGGTFYMVVKAASLLSFFSANSEIAVPASLKDFLKTNPDKNASLIVAFKLKD